MPVKHFILTSSVSVSSAKLLLPAYRVKAWVLLARCHRKRSLWSLLYEKIYRSGEGRERV